jgi:hypothetical protein
VTQRLIRLAASEWATFDGWLASKNIDPMLIGLDRLLNTIYYWATRGATEEADRRKFDASLWMPPKGVEATSGPWSPAAEQQSLLNLASALNIRTAPPPED